MRIHHDLGIDFDANGVTLMLQFVSVASFIHDHIFGHLRQVCDCSEGRFDLLMTLRSAERPLLVTELAGRIMVKPSTVTQMLSRMRKEKVPLVSMTTDPGNRRRHYVSITDAGNEFIERNLPLHVKDLAQFTASLSKDERGELVRLINKLIAG